MFAPADSRYDLSLMWRLLAGLILAALCPAAVPSPADYFGFEPGADHKLADYGQIRGYFQALDRESGRLTLLEFGRSAHGRPMFVAFISSPENLARLEEHREANRRLALGQADAETAERLIRDGKVFVWIDSGLHSTEVAPAQHAPVLAHQLVTGETEEIRRILDRVILIQVPVINPDGHDWVVEWYRSNVGTPHEVAPLPRLYQEYAGHDNNRDWFMMNLVESRHAAKLLYREWFPQIVYNQHQQPAFPARIFVPPYADPLNPHIPAEVMEGIGLIGAAMKERFARENKPGVLSYLGFDAWWNGGLRTAPAFHNMHGILTETAAGLLGTPRVDEEKDLPKRFGNGLPTTEPSIFYQRPWLGGRWGVREAIDYMLTADFAILDLASTRPAAFLRKSYELARAAMEAGQRGGPFAYVVPKEQWDESSALEMLRRLSWAGIEVHRAASEIRAGEKSYPAGSYVLLAGQPFRAYLVDLMEPQRYPDIRDGASGEPKRPYDVAGWTLRMSMGVAVDRIDEPFEGDLQPVAEIPAPGETLDHRRNASFATTADLLARGTRVRWAEDGEILVEGKAAPASYRQARYEIRKPRLGLYVPWTANMDTGWTQWVLDAYGVPYTVLHDADIRRGNLQRGFDSILLASQPPASILHGHRLDEPAQRSKKELEAKAVQRPEYCGGIGIRGLAALDSFVREGGTLIALGSAAGLPVEYFPLPVRDAEAEVAASKKFGSPGSLLRITVDSGHPAAFGMPGEAIGFCRGCKGFVSALPAGAQGGGRGLREIVHYAKEDILASGYVKNGESLQGKPAMVEARHGRGAVVLFGFQPQFRGQTFGTFKLLLNAIYAASAKTLSP